MLFKPERQTSQAQLADEEPVAIHKQNFVDNRSSTIAQRKLIKNIHSSSKIVAQRRMSAAFHNNGRIASPMQMIELKKTRSDSKFQDTSGRPVQRQVWSTGVLDNRQTDVNWTTSKIQGDGTNTTVGVKMIANPLGPDHLQGGPPKSGAQKGLMRQLPTDPKLPTDQKYIRGHLLNDNVGGPGEDFNLFPITGEANHQHEHFIESTVKSWVNDHKQWVKYTVEAKPVKVDMKAETVNATFDCEAQLLNPAKAMQPMDTVKVTIPSIYKGRPPIDGSTAKPSGGLAPVGPQAAKHNPLLSLAKKNAHEYKLDDRVFQVIQQWASMYSGKEIIDYQKIETIGKSLGNLFENVLEDALKFGNLPQTLDKGQKASLTKLNKKAEELIKNFYGLIEKDFGQAFVEVMKQDPILESNYSTSYGYSTNESIFDYMPEPKSSFSDTFNFSPQPGNFQPMPQQQHQGGALNLLNQPVNIAPQHLSMLANNFVQPYSNQFQQDYWSTFDLLGDGGQNVDLVNDNYFDNESDMEADDLGF
ncbi:hypothetical protein [Nitrosomonas sp. wSCUT-2]